MAGNDSDRLTCDGFLDGRLRIWQPRDGYRAATDPVFLAASIPAKPGQSVLDLGCGVGTAALCLGRRVDGLELHGLDIQPEYARLARRNAEENGITLEVHEGDVAAMPPELRQRDFDHVITNPPFFTTDTATGPDNAGKNTAHVGPADSVDVWISAALRRLLPGGFLSIIHRAERLDDILAALHGVAGDCRVLPIIARPGRAANRVLVQSRKGRKGALQLLWPFVVHDGESHREDGENFTQTARSILRNMVNLPL